MQRSFSRTCVRDTHIPLSFSLRHNLLSLSPSLHAHSAHSFVTSPSSLHAVRMITPLENGKTAIIWGWRCLHEARKTWELHCIVIAAKQNSLLTIYILSSVLFLVPVLLELISSVRAFAATFIPLLRLLCMRERIRMEEQLSKRSSLQEMTGCGFVRSFFVRQCERMKRHQYPRSNKFSIKTQTTINRWMILMKSSKENDSLRSYPSMEPLK